MLMEPGNFSVTLLEGELCAVECTVGEGRWLIRSRQTSSLLFLKGFRPDYNAQNFVE